MCPAESSVPVGMESKGRGIWLLRHGAVVTGPHRSFVGQRDVPLSEEGLRQYHRLAQLLVQNLNDHLPRAICCSDLSRSHVGASILQVAFRQTSKGDVPVVSHTGLREISLGAWEGLSKTDVDSRFPGALAARGRDFAGYVPHGGESFFAVQQRACQALKDIRMQIPEGLLIVVGHAAVNRTLIAFYLNLPLSDVMRIPQPYACQSFLAGW